MNPWLVCGVTGLVLQDGERRLLEELGPGGVILFARNVHDAAQVAELAAALRALPSQPYVAVDMEGGRVNRLAKVFGPLPAPAQAAAAGTAAALALGRALGAVCAHLGITVDYAPVVDVARARGYIGGEGRCLGSSPAEVVEAAAAFLQGLESLGVAGCLKHYPGLGAGAVDSHHELPCLDDSVLAEEAVFTSLAGPARAVMVAHAMAPALGEAHAPASLSAAVVGRLARTPCGPVIADDLAMGALARHGSLGERACAALLAGCHQVLVCNALEERRGVVEHVLAAAARSPELGVRLAEAALRCAGYGQGPLAAVTWKEAVGLAEEARTAVAGWA